MKDCKNKLKLKKKGIKNFFKEWKNRANLNDSENNSFGKAFLTFLGIAITVISTRCEIF